MQIRVAHLIKTFLSAALAVVVLSTSTAAADFSIEEDFIAKALEVSVSDKLDMEKVTAIDSFSHTEIVPQYANSRLYFTFRYDEAALKDPSLLIKDLAIISALNVRPAFRGKPCKGQRII